MIRIMGRVSGNFTNKYIIEGKYVFNGRQTTPLRYVFDNNDEGKVLLEKYYRVLYNMMECQDEMDYSIIDDFDELFQNNTSYGPAWPKDAEGAHAQIAVFSVYFYDEDSNKFKVEIE